MGEVKAFFGDISPTICAQTYHHGTIVNQDLNQQMMVSHNGVVRKLTHRECEALQGFPLDWTIGFANAHRYRMMGNAVAVPVVEWIVAGIVGVHNRV